MLLPQQRELLFLICELMIIQIVLYIMLLNIVRFALFGRFQ